MTQKKNQVTNSKTSVDEEWVRNNVPFQVQHLVNSMLNGKDNVYIRGNYRTRLSAISQYIDDAIKKYDNEVVFTNTRGRPKKNG